MHKRSKINASAGTKPRRETFTSIISLCFNCALIGFSKYGNNGRNRNDASSRFSDSSRETYGSLVYFPVRHGRGMAARERGSFYLRTFAAANAFAWLRSL